MAGPYMCMPAGAKTVATPLQQTMVVFPMDNSAGEAGVQVAEDLTAFIRGGLAAHPTYEVLTYSQRIPTIQRLVKLEPEKNQVLDGPFHTDRTAIANAVALAKAMSAQLIVVGSVDRYVVSDQGVADLVSTVEVIDVATGKTIRTVVVTGKSGRAPAGSSLAQAPIATQAIADVGAKIVSGIIGSTEPTQQAVNTQTKKKKNYTWLAAVLLAVGIAVVSGSHGSNSSSEPGPPNPPPL